MLKCSIQMRFRFGVPATMAQHESACESWQACYWLLNRTYVPDISGIASFACFNCLETFTARLSRSMDRATELNLVAFCSDCDFGYVVKDLQQVQAVILDSLSPS